MTEEYKPEKRQRLKIWFFVFYTLLFVAGIFVAQIKDISYFDSGMIMYYIVYIVGLVTVTVSFGE